MIPFNAKRPLESQSARLGRRVKLISELFLFLRREAAATCSVLSPHHKLTLKKEIINRSQNLLSFRSDLSGTVGWVTQTFQATDQPLVSANDVPGSRSFAPSHVFAQISSFIMIQSSEEPGHV